MDIFSLLNTLVIEMTRAWLKEWLFFSMYNTIYIFPKFTYGISAKKLKDKFPDKNKNIFSITKI